MFAHFGPGEAVAEQPHRAAIGFAADHAAVRLRHTLQVGVEIKPFKAVAEPGADYGRPLAGRCRTQGLPQGVFTSIAGGLWEKRIV